MRPQAVPPSLLPALIDFRCFTPKLHYQPGEPIEYRTVLSTWCCPDRASSRILTVKLRNGANEIMASAVQQYGIRPGTRIKEVQKVLDVDAPLKPGKYVLEATSRDPRSGLTVSSQHVFGIQGPGDPFLYETPFKFVKDFSIVQAEDGRWHIFSITGDLLGSHTWEADGQERTFSHASSVNLRDWTSHPPVISISDDAYADGKGRFKDRNVWAPHVIRHDGRYWMFYTSVIGCGVSSIRGEQMVAVMISWMIRTS